MVTGITRNYLRYTSAQLDTINTGSRRGGFYIRCIKDSTVKTMQTFSESDASAMTTNQVTTLTDSRDGQKYAVTKLADGNVWMTQNLRLGYNANNPNTSTISLDPSDSNVTVARTITTYDAATYGSNYCYGQSTSGSAVNYACVHSSSNMNYGVYYNYVATTAGTITGTSNTTNASESICPAGWRLPTKAEFSGITSYVDVFSPVAAGYVLRGSISATTDGIYYSSTADNQNERSFLRYYSSNNTAEVSSVYRYASNSVRCIKDYTTISDLSTMQEWGDLTDVQKTRVIDSMTTNTSYSLTDTRDARSYTVAKLSDGNVWMTQNLKLGTNTTSVALTMADSDVPSSGFTLDGKLSNGKFTYSTIGAVQYQNDSSQYYCTSNYGCYYNWYTSTASSGDSTVSSGDVSYSICPKGWTLPTEAQFVALGSAYGNSATSLLVSPTSSTENTNGASVPGFLLGGYYYNTGSNKINSAGLYWTGTAQSAEDGYVFLIDASTVTPAHHGTKYVGRAVRCLAK